MLSATKMSPLGAVIKTRGLVSLVANSSTLNPSGDFRPGPFRPSRRPWADCEPTGCHKAWRGRPWSASAGPPGASVVQSPIASLPVRTVAEAGAGGGLGGLGRRPEVAAPISRGRAMRSFDRGSRVMIEVSEGAGWIGSGRDRACKARAQILTGRAPIGEGRRATSTRSGPGDDRIERPQRPAYWGGRWAVWQALHEAPRAFCEALSASRSLAWAASSIALVWSA